MTQEETAADEETTKRQKGRKKVITYVDLLGMQVDHFFSKDGFWYAAAWTQAILFFKWSPILAQNFWPLVENCLVPDVQHGKVQGLNIQRVPKDESAECYFLPEGFKLTYCQFFFAYVIVMGSALILVMNLGFWFIYKNKFAVFEQYKIEKDQPWPWEADKEGWRDLVRRATIQSIINNTLVAGFCCYLTCSMFSWQLPWKYGFADLPDSWTMARQICIFIIFEDFTFHFSHRLFHCKSKYLPMYQMFHKVHHEFSHPISVAAENSHPVEFAFGNHYPAFVGIFLLGSKVHIWTIMNWGILRVLESHESHCGYELPWSIFRIIPFGADASYHIFHHSKNVGNYSTFMTIWDTVFNTNLDYYEEHLGAPATAKPSRTHCKDDQAFGAGLFVF